MHPYENIDEIVKRYVVVTVFQDNPMLILQQLGGLLLYVSFEKAYGLGVWFYEKYTTCDPIRLFRTLNFS